MTHVREFLVSRLRRRLHGADQSPETRGNSLTAIGRFTVPRPINKAAADAVFQANDETWEAENKNHGQAHSCVGVPPLRDVPRDVRNRIGVRFGRLTVIGLRSISNAAPSSIFGRDRTSMTLRWVCRCACGCHELRKDSAVTNPRNVNDRCYECRKLDRIKAAELFRSSGIYTCAACGAQSADGGCRRCDAAPSRMEGRPR